LFIFAQLFWADAQFDPTRAIIQSSRTNPERRLFIPERTLSVIPGNGIAGASEPPYRCHLERARVTAGSEGESKDPEQVSPTMRTQDATTVVDSELRVHSVEGLRV